MAEFLMVSSELIDEYEIKKISEIKYQNEKKLEKRYGLITIVRKFNSIN